MLIDGFTVAAQLLNFLVLVWLLHRFLYRPILAAIDAREIRIAAELADVEAKKLTAQTFVDEWTAKSRIFDGERGRLLEVARADATALRERLVADDRKAAEVSKGQQAQGIISDNIRIGQEITRLVQLEVFAIARKALADLATATLEASIVEMFICRLKILDAGAHQILEKAIRESADPCIVSTRFDLPPAQRSDVQKALDGSFSFPIRVRFETASDSIGGIELNVGGQKLAWGIVGYLDALEQQLDSTLRASSPVPARAAPTPGPAPATIGGSAVAA